MKANNTRINSVIPILAALIGIGLSLPKPAQAQCVSPPANLVSWWRAEGDATDFADGNHGTLQSGTTFAAGKVGQAFSFDGIDNYVNVPDSASLDLTTEFTVEAWVMPLASKSHRAITKWGTRGFRSFTIDIDGWGIVYFSVSSDGSTYASRNTGPGAVIPNQWTHVAAVFRGAMFQRIYVNGQQGDVGSGGTVPAAMYSSTTPIRLARNFQDTDGNASNFRGLLDEVAIYSRALSQVEIQAIVDAGSDGKCTNAPPTVTCPMPVSVNCAPPFGLELTLTTHVADAEGDALTVEWKVGPNVVLTTSVPAGGSPSGVDVSLTYMFIPGTHQIHVTVDDGTNVPVECGSIVEVNPETEAPMLTCPHDVSAETDANCLAAAPDVTALVSASDECTPTGSLTLTQDPLAGTLLGPGTHTVTVTATDGGGNSTSCNVPFEVVDRLAPLLVGLPDNQTVDCPGVPTPPIVAAIDNCEGTVQVTYAEAILPGDCSASLSIVQRTWTAADSAGNSVSETRTVTLVDSVPPELAIPADLTIECGTSIDPAVTGFPVATDTCDGTPTITFSDESAPGACSNAATITRTWTATDDCGNATLDVHIITTIDTTPPVIGLPDATEGTPNALWHAGGHSGSIPTAVFTADASHIISGGPEGTLRIWRTADSVLERILYGHTGAVISVALSLDEATIYSGSYDGTIRAWRRSDGAFLSSFDTGTPIRDMVLTPDGTSAVASHYSDETYQRFVRVWRLSDGMLLLTLPQALGGGPVAVSPNGMHVASLGVGTAVINLWRLSDGAYPHSIDLGITSLQALEFSPDSATLGVATSFLSAGGPNVRLFNVADGALLRGFEAAQSVISLAFAPDGLTLAAGVGLGGGIGKIHVYDPADGSLIRALWRPDSFGYTGMLAPMTLEYSADSTQLLAGSGGHYAFNTSPENDSLDLWDVATGDHIRGITQHRLQVSAVAYNAARNIVVSGSHDWTVRMHDADTGTPVPPVMVSGGPIQVVSVSADGTRIATGGDEPRFRVWDAITGTVIRTFEAPHHIPGQGNVGATGLALSADGETVVSSGNVEVRFWSVATGEMLREVRTFGGGSFTISPDGETIATLAGAVILWRASDGVVLRSLSMECSANTVAFSPDGALIAVGDGHGAFCGNSLTLFRVADGAMLYRVPTGAGNVANVAFSPSGNFIATGSIPVYALNGEIGIWRAADGTLVNRFTNVGKGVLDIAYTSDDNHFAFGRSDAALTLATPSPTAAPPTDLTIPCGDPIPPPPPLIAGDNCDLNPTLTFTEIAASEEGDIDHTLTRTWTSTDACGNTASQSQIVTVMSCNQPPVAVCSGAITREATSPAGTSVTLDGSLSSDPDGDTLLYHWDVSDLSVVLDDPTSSTPIGMFAVGVTMATLTVADGRGGVATCDVVITVTDSTPPIVGCTTDLAMLWPPDHTMRQVTLFVVADDAAQSPGSVRPTVFLRSDEADDANGNGDGSTTGDVNGANGFTTAVDVSHLFVWNASLGANGTWVATVQLRAERAGSGDGRCYVIDSFATDGFGNSGMCSSCVVVPHDQRR